MSMLVRLRPIAAGCAVAGIGIGVAAVWSLWMGSSLRQAASRDFRWTADQHCRLLAERIANRIEQLEVLQATFTADRQEERERFTTVSRRILRSTPVWTLVGRVAVVPSGRRSEHEAQERKAGRDFYLVHDLNEGRVVPAAARPLHLPLTGCEAIPAAPLAGRDLAADPVRLALARRALDGGRPAVGVAALPLAGGDGSCLVVFIPSSAGRPADAACVLAESLLKDLVGSIFPEHGDLAVTLRQSDGKLLFGDDQAKGWAQFAIPVGDQTWSVACRPAGAWTDRHWPWPVLAGLGLGSVLSLFAGWLVTGALANHQRTQQAMQDRTEALTHEITVRRRTEGDLHRAKGQLELLAAAVARTDAGIAIASVRGGRRAIVFVNPAFSALIRLPSQDHLGTELDRFLGGGSDLSPPMQLALAEGRSWSGDLLLARADGSRFWAQLALGPLRDEAKHITHWIVVVHDASDRKQAEELLRESEERFRLLAENAPVMIWTTDTDGRLTYVNRRLGEFAGRDLVAATRDEVSALVHPEDRDAWMAAILAAHAGHHRHEHEYRVRRADGQWRWIHDVGVPRTGTGGDYGGFVVVARDITDERELIASLRAAKDAAEAADAAKGSFLAMVSHEMRTPLHGILGMTGLLLDELEDAHQRELASTAQSCGNHLLGIVSDVLDYSRIAAGRMVLDQADFDLRTVIEESLATLGEAAQAKGLELAAHIDPTIPHLLIGDAARLRQVLVNLLGNAVKFTETGAVVLQVAVPHDARSHRTPPPEPATGYLSLVLAVRDTGIGIPAEALPRLFQPFSQVDGSATRRHGGTGLGLAICRSLIELMGGTIRVQSRPGEGTVITCAIRLAVSSAPAHDGDAEPFPFGRQRVLIASPRRQEAAMFGLMLADLGCDCESVHDPIAAQAAAERVEIVLWDADWPRPWQAAAGVERPPLVLIRALAQRTAGEGFAAISRPPRRAALRETLLMVLKGRMRPES